MILVEAIPRRWGNSVGISLSKEIVEKANIKPNKEIKLFIQEKKVDLSHIFGSLKITQPTQKILDEIREGED